jgi:hypothetical protein
MISSAVFVHTKGRGLSFQPAIQERISGSSPRSDWASTTPAPRASTPSYVSSSDAPEASTAPTQPSPSSHSPADRSPYDYPTNNPTLAQDDPHSCRERQKTLACQPCSARPPATAREVQIEYGLLTDVQAHPVAIRIFPGNTADPTAFIEAVEVVRTKFGLRRLIMVGDRGMTTTTAANAATPSQSS